MSEGTLYATIDRFETDEAGNHFAVLAFDDGQQLILPVSRLPEGCQDGTVLMVNLTPDHAETERRLQQVKQVQSRLFGSRSSE